MAIRDCRTISCCCLKQTAFRVMIRISLQVTFLVAKMERFREIQNILAHTQGKAPSNGLLPLWERRVGFLAGATVSTWLAQVGTGILRWIRSPRGAKTLCECWGRWDQQAELPRQSPPDQVTTFGLDPPNSRLLCVCWGLF